MVSHSISSHADNNIMNQIAFLIIIILCTANCGLLSLSAADNISTPSVMHSGLPIEGSMANLSCPPGMILNGTNTTICTRNGVWEPNPQNVNCVAG